MLTNSHPNRLAHPENKIEHRQAPEHNAVPAQAMSLPVLKAIEQRLGERGLLSRHKVSYPLWFLAETERNIFLWRKGCSLSEQDRFEFWVDIVRLVEKRKTGLRSGLSHTTAGCDTSAGDRELGEKECLYLDQLTELLFKVGDHAHALSQVGLMVEKEIGRDARQRQVVVLPATAA